MMKILFLFFFYCTALIAISFAFLLPITIAALQDQPQQQNKTPWYGGSPALSTERGQQPDHYQSSSSSMMPALRGFEYFDLEAKIQHRAAVTLVVDCSQGFDPCIPHGKCAIDKCICDSDPQKGFWSGDDCKECDSGWAGQECKIECKGGACNACSGHGLCSDGVPGDGSCTCNNQVTGYWDGVDCSVCKAGYFGEDCDKSCPGAEFGSACWGRGECRAGQNGEGVCFCDPGYESALGCFDCDAASFSSNCDKKCDGYVSESNLPCSGHGVCFNGTARNGTCTCHPSWGTWNCSLQCPGQGCSGHGRCNDGVLGDATCQCEPGWSLPDCARCMYNATGPDCDLLCPTNVNQVPCSGHGECVFLNEKAECICAPGYNNSACELACPGNPPCSGNGECEWTSGGGVCKCFKNSAQGFWSGPTCSVCDLAYNNSENCTTPCPTYQGRVCNNRGFCHNGKCICDRRNPNNIEYCGIACETSSARFSSGGQTCEKCSCEYCPDYFGTGNCITSRCPSVSNTDPAFACSGNGRCIEGKNKVGQCLCYSGHSGADCGRECPKMGKLPCGGFDRGMCEIDATTGRPVCNCRNGFAGLACNISCPVWGDQVCSGHGFCNNSHAADGTCKCDPGWTGKACNVPCACNMWNGQCDHKNCSANKPTEVCYQCDCVGNYTDLCQRCKLGTQGRSCEGPCVNGNTTGKECKCEMYWSGPACDIPCPRDAENGTICGGRGVCLWGNKQSGTCKCPTNWYGVDCTKYCDPFVCTVNGSLNPQCNPLTGACECKNDVTGRWAGDKCEKCVEGYFGDNCEQSCVCSDHGSCDKSSGACQCFQSPERGFYSGQQCETCTPGYIGSNCERKSVAYTKVKLTIENAPELYPSPHLFGSIPTTEVLFVDEETEKTYVGGFPLVQLDSNMSTPEKMVFKNQSSRAPFRNNITYPGELPITKDCYNEVAYVFVHATYIYYLMHPQIQCNVSARLLRQPRSQADAKLETADLVWEMPADLSFWRDCEGCQDWGNRTSRIVSADSVTQLSSTTSSSGAVEEPIVAFIMAQPVRTQWRAWEPSCIVVRVRVELTDSAATRSSAAVGKYLNTSFEMQHITVRERFEPETTGKIMLSGRLIGTSSFDTWELLELSWDIAGWFPQDLNEASLRRKIQCWPLIADLSTSSFKCDQCSDVGGAFYHGKSILLGMNHPETIFGTWVRRFAEVKDENKIFHARFRNKCERARYDEKTSQIVSLATGLTTREEPTWVALVASAAVPNSDIVSMTIDRAVSQLHFSLTIFPTSSIMVKMTFANNDFSILGTRELGFVPTVVVGGTIKTQPETFTRLYPDSHSRVLYGIYDSVKTLNIIAFLMYDTLSVTPNIADQRGQTVITVNGTGFKQIIKSGTASTPLFTPTCRFSNGVPVPATDLSPYGMRCVTAEISEADIVASCSAQQVEVSLFSTVWFTENNVNLRRVRAAKIEGQVRPERGPLSSWPKIDFSGTGFIDSPFAVCRFSSDNQDPRLPKETLFSKLNYVSRTEAWCRQPSAKFPSPDFSYLDVSLDGQLFMETQPPFYTIVGAPANISTDTVITAQAANMTRIPIYVEIVDKLNHWVAGLGALDREICLDTQIVENEVCAPELLTWRQDDDPYPQPFCRENQYILQDGTNCRIAPNSTGNVSFDDLFFIQPRSGVFKLRLTHTEDFNSIWSFSTTIQILPGKPHALALSNREPIAKRLYFPPSQALNPAPEIVVLDSLGNKISQPPSTLIVYAQQYYVFDNNHSVAYWTRSEQKKAPDSDNVRFTNIFFRYLNGVSHYVNFTSNLDLKNAVLPPLRTDLCDNPTLNYKVALTPDCAPCPPEGATCNGTEIIQVWPGYWRDASDTDIYKCPGGEEVCVGSLSAPNGSFCQTGYTGPLCSLCEPGWGKSGSTKCQPCPPIGNSIAIIVVTAVFLIMGLTGWTINILHEAEVTDLSIVLRTVVNHMQAAGKLGEFSTNWSPFLKSVFDIQNSASGLSFSGLSSISCVISDAGSDHQAVFIGYMALPSLTIVMTLLVLLTVRVARLKPVLTEKLHADVIEEVKNMPTARIGILLVKYPWYQVLTTTVSIFMFTLYQTLITQATSVLTCRELTIRPGENKQYLAVDMSIECDESGDHKFKTAAYLAAVAYGVGIPSAFVFGYRVLLQTLGNRDLVNMMFQFLIGGYKPQFWWWQAIIMARKLVLVLVITFVAENPQLQSYGGMWTMAVALVLQIWYEPYERDTFNRVEALSLAIITITLNLGLLYYWDDLPAFGANVLTAFLILVTIGVIFMFAYYMYEPIKDTVQMKIQQLKTMHAEWVAARNAPKEDRSLSLRNVKLDYRDDEEDDGVAHMNSFQGTGRDRSERIVADFDVEDLGIPKPSSMVSTAAPSSKKRGGSGSGKRERRAMPLLSDDFNSNDQDSYSPPSAAAASISGSPATRQKHGDFVQQGTFGFADL